MNGTIKTLIGFVAGAAAGSAVTYFIVNKKAEAKWQAISETEIDEVKKRYGAIRKVDYVSPEVDEDEEAMNAGERLVAQVIRDQNKLLTELGYSEEQIEDFRAGVPDADLTEVIQEEEFQRRLEEGRDEDIPSEEESRETLERVNNIFDAGVSDEEAGNPIATDNEHYHAIEEDRRAGLPYIISVDEFMENDDFEKISITYYEGDDVLADERDMPIDDVDQTVGNDNLNRFGWESKDKNVVYVRNDRMQAFFEIAKDTRAYTEVVAGIAQHSSVINNPKFRDDD